MEATRNAGDMAVEKAVWGKMLALYPLCCFLKKHSKISFFCVRRFQHSREERASYVRFISLI
jgi:hypothetical protein